LAEARLGWEGQALNYVFNDLTTPWIWSVVKFDQNGTPSWDDLSMFSTHSIYFDGELQVTVNQSPSQTFIDQGHPLLSGIPDYERTPDEIQ
jgi:hypothetical protein